MKKKEIKIDRFTKVYIILVLFIFSIVYLTIIISGKMYMFLDIGADTYCSYWPSIAYVKSLLTDMKLWDMRLGLGSSTILYISYFLLDPFNWICFFFSKENIDIGLFIGVTLKYLCLSYYAYQYIKIKGIKGYSKIISALMLVFCGWFIGWGQHYNFATVFVLFVAILYYFEYWMKNKKYVKLILATMLLTIISPYYSYMILLFLIFYYFISLYLIYKEKKFTLKEGFVHSIKTATIFCVGLGCSAFIFLPYIGDIFVSPRVTGNRLPSLSFGSLQEYMSLILRMFSNSILSINVNYAGYQNFYETPFMYVGILFVLIVPLFLGNKKLRKNYLMVIFGTISVFIFINFSSVVFNAFSTKTYRWTFLFMPIFVLACGKALDNLCLEKYKKIFFLEALFWNITLIIYSVWYYNKYNFNKLVIVNIGIVLLLLNIYIIVLILLKNKKYFYKTLLLVLTIDLCSNAFMSVHARNLILRSSRDSMGFFDNTNDALRYLESIDSSFYRVKKNYNLIDLNDSMFQDYNGEKFYSSILSAEIWDMMELFDLRVKYSNYFYGFDDKQILRNLTVGKYRFTKTPSNYYGHKLINIIGDVYIYKNLNCIDFGVLYDSYVLRSELEELNQYELQNLLLDSCIIEDEEYDLEIQKLSRNNNNKNIDMQLICEKKDLNTESCSINLKSENSEPLLLELSATNSNGNIEIFSNGENEYISDSIPYSIIDKKKIYYIDTLNISRLVINSTEGNINSFRLYQIDGNELTKKINALKNNCFNISDFSDTYISGYTNCSNNQLLFLPIPYNKNWNISINERKVKVYKADAGFMAVLIPQGHAEIEIKYVSNYFYIGCIITCISFLGLLIVLIKIKKRGKYNEKKWN